MGKFVIRTTKTGFTFQLKAGNGEAIATSEVYSSLDSCKNGIASVQKNAPIAPIEDLTAAEPKAEKCPKFELYEDKAGKFRFRLKAGNGEPIAASEPYSGKESCKNGIDSVKRNAPGAEIAEE
ncbi:MAG: YegP family protein [Ruthenibacterium sp.]